MSDSVVIFMFFFDCFTLLVCAYLLNKLMQMEQTLKAFSLATALYIQAYNEAVKIFNQVKEISNHNVEVVKQVAEEVNAALGLNPVTADEPETPDFEGKMPVISPKNGR